MKKRILSLVLVFILALSLLPTTASALDYSYKSWSQGDSRWGSMSISSNGTGNNSMARVGCYVTAIAKLLVHAGQQDPASFTPKDCLEGLLGHGMLSTDGDIYYGSFNNSFLPAYGPQLTKETSPNHGEWDKNTAVSTIGGKIQDGYYVIVCVINRATGNTHYMTVDYVSDDIYVMDNGGVYAVYGSGRYSGVCDQVYFKYSGPHRYPVYTTIHTEVTKPDTTGTTKTQYRYHRYEDNKGEYAVCAYWGNATYNTTMHLVYSDWLDAPLPEVKQGYVNYLEHPWQGSSCANAGCLSTDPFEVHRHVDASGKVWYYEETRTVTAEKPVETPNCDKGHTWGEWQITKEVACNVPGERQRTCDVCGKTEINKLPALSHDYKIDRESNTTIYYVCAICGEGYHEEKEAPPTTTPNASTTTPDTIPNTPEPSDEPTVASKLPLPSTRSYIPDLFWDVKGNDWFYGNVADVYAMGLMNGTGAATFSPGNNMTLAEAVTLAARIHSLYYNGKEDFSRYDGGSWYDPYVDYARENRIIDVNYDYSRPATREEFVHILARALPEAELDNIAGTVSFTDSRDITYMADVRLLSGAGVINGIPEGGKVYFKPNATITRAEVAAVVARMVRPDSRIGA